MLLALADLVGRAQVDPVLVDPVHLGVGRRGLGDECVYLRDSGDEALFHA